MKLNSRTRVSALAQLAVSNSRFCDVIKLLCSLARDHRTDPFVLNLFKDIHIKKVRVFKNKTFRQQESFSFAP